MKDNSLRNQMIIDIYTYDQYRKIFKDCIENSPAKGKGLRKEIAQFIRCQPTYISHVLSGKYHFSQEQTEAACRFFSFSKDGTDYTMLLLNHERAGNKELKSYYKEKIVKLRKQALAIRSVVPDPTKLTTAESAIYYSQWHYAAIHIMVELEDMASIDELAKKLRLSKEVVNDAVDFLRSAKIIGMEEGRYIVLKKNLHIDNQSTDITHHHRNLRLKAMEVFPFRGEESLYFSSFLSCKKDDIPLLRKKILNCIHECSQTINDSPPQVVSGLNIDFFQI